MMNRIMNCARRDKPATLSGAAGACFTLDFGASGFIEAGLEGLVYRGLRVGDGEQVKHINSSHPE